MAKEAVSDNKYGFSSFILGIFSLILSFMIVPTLLMAPLSIIFSIIQFKKKKSNFAIVGLILSIVGLIISIVLLVALFKIASLAGLAIQCQNNPGSSACDQFISKLGPSLDPQIAQCIKDPSAPGCEQLVGSYLGSGVQNAP